jgi:hypothetical protein
VLSARGLDDIRSAACDQRRLDVLGQHAGQRPMLEIYLDRGPPVELECAPAFVRADLEQLCRREDAPQTGLTACDALQLAQLLERIEPHVRVRADAQRDRAFAHGGDAEEAVAEIGLGRGARADP